MEYTIEEWLEQLEIQQAWRDGEQLQFKSKSSSLSWITCTPRSDCDTVDFAFDKYEYRIKPKAREIWVVTGKVFLEEKEAKQFGINNYIATNRVRKFREVLEDE